MKVTELAAIALEKELNWDDYTLLAQAVLDAESIIKECADLLPHDYDFRIAKNWLLKYSS